MMKKITLLLILLTVSLGYSQQQQYLLDFESGDPDGTVSNWFTFDNTPPPAEIIDNPDPDGTNPTVTKVLKVVMGPGNAFYAGVNNGWAEKAFGTWALDAAVPSNLTLSMDVNKNYVGTIGIKMGTDAGGTSFQVTDQNVGNTVVNEWQTLTWTLPTPPPGLETNISQIVVFVDWTEGQADRAEGNTIYIDNITWGANKLSDPVVPTCDDGIMNGDEEGVDCGGSCPNACIADPEPAVAAPTPTLNETANQVISIFSNAYTNVPGTDFDPNWGQATDATIEMVAGNETVKYANLNYQGTQYTAQDVSGLTHVHIDYWTFDSTALNFSLISVGPLETFFPLPTTSLETWVSVDIPLSHFVPPVNLTDAFQFKVDGNGTVWFDNIYFYNDTALSTGEFELSNVKVFPNPTNDVWTVKTTSSISSIKVLDVLGKVVITLTPDTNEANIDGSKLKSGIYFAQIKSEFGMKSTKLIKR